MREVVKTTDSILVFFVFFNDQTHLENISLCEPPWPSLRPSSPYASYCFLFSSSESTCRQKHPYATFTSITTNHYSTNQAQPHTTFAQSQVAVALPTATRYVADSIQDTKQRIVNLLVYVQFICVILCISLLFYCTVLLCNLAQELPSGLIKLYFMSYFILISFGINKVLFYFILS